MGPSTVFGTEETTTPRVYLVAAGLFAAHLSAAVGDLRQHWPRWPPLAPFHLLGQVAEPACHFMSSHVQAVECSITLDSE